MAVPDWVTFHLCPAIGVILCTVMWCAPMPAMKMAIRSGDLGDVNPVPFLVMVCNCIGWVVYSVIQRDFYIFWSNAPGIVLGVYYSLNTMLLLHAKAHEDKICKSDKNELNPKPSLSSETCGNILLGIASWWSLIVMIVGIALPKSNDVAPMLVGIICDVITISFYAAPLSVAFEVVKKRDAALLSLPVCIANTINSFMWVLYGLIAVNDLFIYIPNGIGCILGVIQLVLIMIFGKKNDHSDPLFATVTLENKERSNSRSYSVEGKADHADEEGQEEYSGKEKLSSRSNKSNKDSYTPV